MTVEWQLTIYIDYGSELTVSGRTFQKKIAGKTIHAYSDKKEAENAAFEIVRNGYLEKHNDNLSTLYPPHKIVSVDIARINSSEI